MWGWLGLWWLDGGRRQGLAGNSIIANIYIYIFFEADALCWEEYHFILKVV